MSPRHRRVPARRRPDCRSSRGKQVLDRIGAALALTAFGPVIAAVAAWIRVTEGKPVLFVQERAGRDGVPFRMLKFRTMINDSVALSRRWGLSDDPYAIVENDPRITATGRFLRRTSLDELPQLVNVLVGHMSLVGPRPDVLPQVALYDDVERGRLRVRPGMTGWVQVNGRESLPWAERFPLDAWYIEHWSHLLDLRILWRTVASVGRTEPEVVADDFHHRRRWELGA